MRTGEELAPFQYRIQACLSFQGESGGSPLGMDRNVFLMVTTMGRKEKGHLLSSNTGTKRNCAKLDLDVLCTKIEVKP